MKIRTQFILTLSLFGLVLIVMVVSLVVTNQQVDRLNQQYELANRIEQGADKLSYISGNYLMYGESQQRARWESIFASFSNDVSKLQPANLEQQTIIAHIKEDQANLQAVFGDVAAVLERSPQSSGAAANLEFMQVSWSRIEVQNQSMAFEASVLSQQLHKQADRLRQMNLILIFVLIGIFGAYLITNYYLLYRRPLRSIAELQAGTEIIGSGNLDFTIATRRSDEIGELAHAFNRMTANLKAVTASKADLEREIAERKQAEEALRESEQRYSIIFDKAPFAMSLTKMPQGALVDVNNAFLKLFGFTREEAIGTTSLDLELADADSRAQIAAGIRSHGSVHDFEVTRTMKTGERCILSLNLDPVSIDGAEHILTTIRDVTARRQAEEAAHRNEALLQAILDNVPEPIYLKDCDGRLLLANPATLAVIGKPAAAVIGKTDMEFYDDPAAGRAIMENDRRIMDSGQVEIFEESVSNPDGTRVYLSTKAPYRDASGQIIGLIGVATDITERKRAEEVVRENEARLQALFSAIPNVVLEYDTSGRPVRANRAALNAVGVSSLNFTRDDAVARLNFRNLDGRIPKKQDLPTSRALQGEMVTGDLFAVTTADGGERIISVYAAPIYQHDRTIQGVVALWHDITELKSVESALQDANEELQVTTEELRQQNDELLHTQSALRQSEERFRLALTHAPVSVATQDRDLRFTWAYNQRTRRTDEIVGKTDIDLFPLEASHLRELKHRVMETGENLSEKLWVTSNNQRLFLDLFIEPLRNDSGEIDGVGVATVDLTEVKRAEDSLQDMNNKLQAQAVEMEKQARDLQAARLAAMNLMEDALDSQRETEKVNALLRQSEQRLNRAQEIAHLGSWELDLVNNRLTWSDEVYRIFGLQPQEFDATYEAFLEAVHPDDRAAVDDAYSVSIRDGKDSYEIEHRVVRRSSGELRIVHEKCEHFRNEGGQIVRSVGMVHDMTERKMAEEALRASEEKYRNLFENMTEEVHFWKLVRDEEGHIKTWQLVDANPPALKTWGHTTVDEIRGKTTDEIFGPGAKEHYMPIVDKIMTEGVPYFYEDFFPHLDKYFRFTSVPFGEYFITTGADITSIKKAEQALRLAHDQLELRVQERTWQLAVANKELLREISERKQVEQRLRIQTTAMDAAANGIIITDPRGNIQWANPATKQISGYEPEELLGQNMRIFRSGHHGQDYYSHMWSTIFSGNAWRGEMVNRRKDGSLYSEEQTITPVQDENNQIMHFIAIKQDISERKRAETELERRNKELQEISLAEHEQRQLAEALVRAVLVLNKSLKLDEVFTLLLEQVREVIPYQLADIVLLDGESFYDASHRGDVDWPEAQISVNQRFALEAFPIFNKMRSSGEPALIQDTQAEPDWIKVEGLAWSRSFLSAPLLVEEKVIGFVNLFAEQPGFFNQKMSDRLAAFAAHAAVAIQNAWLFEQVRAGSERLQSLSRRLVEVQETERLYISRELHDEAGQVLTSLLVDLKLLEKNASKPKALMRIVAEMENSLNAVIENLHRIAMALRPASLDHVGLVAALRQHTETVGDKTGLSISFSASNVKERMHPNVETVIYRIVQEALTNIVRHAKATSVDIVLTVRGDQLIVIVEDDGIGFDPDSLPSGDHLGLFGMRERTEMIGGKFTIESAPGKGTTVMVEVNYADSISDRR